MLQIEHVSLSYDGGRNYAVKDLSLNLRAGEIFGLLGPNGAGKTTTLKMVTGILSPNTGRVLVNGHDIIKEPVEAKQSFSYVPDDPNMFLRLKGIEYLNFMTSIYRLPTEGLSAKIEKLARDFDLFDRLNESIQNYSHGMRQKIVLIAALLHNPPVWILDEPMIGLDPRSTYLLKQMMRQHADQGNLVLFSTHVLDVAEKICDRIAIIDHGCCVASGTMEELRQQHQSDDSLEKLFLDLTADAEEQFNLQALEQEAEQVLKASDEA